MEGFLLEVAHTFLLSSYMAPTPPTSFSTINAEKFGDVEPNKTTAKKRDSLYEVQTYIQDRKLKINPLWRSSLNIVEEQIDKTDIRKIPQIVWAESGSLTVPV